MLTANITDVIASKIEVHLLLGRHALLVPKFHLKKLI